MRNKTILLGAAALGAGRGFGTLAFGQGAPVPSPRRRSMPAARPMPTIAPCAISADMAGTNDAPQLAGTAFIGAWKGRTTQALYSKISKTMPAGARRQPG